MSVRSVIVRLEAEVAGYVAGMGKAASATDKVGKANQQMGPQTKQAHEQASQAAQKHKDAAEQVGQTAVVAGAATVAGVGLAIKTYADFDKQMSSVKAATHETAGNMDALRDAAVAAGSDTAFSAVEAAQGIEELAKAGVATKDILGGGLAGALDLAAAGSLEVGTAAEIAASALTQFKLSGDKVPHLADLLAAGAGKAQGSVEDLGAALNQSGLVASSTGATIEETTGALAAFASAGLTGSDAGTSFKTMLMALNPSSEAAATLMEDLGISAYDANGEFIGMSEYAGVLQGALKDMSSEQRNATLKTLFGTDAVRAANVMYEQGEAGIQKWEEAVNDAGYAAETAAAMQDNLAGDLEKLGGAFDTVLLQSGSGANAVLRDMVQALEGVIDGVGQIPAPVLSVATMLAGVVGGAALLGGGLITVLPKIRDTRDAMKTLAPAGSKVNGVLSRTGSIAGKAATGIALLGTASALAAPLLDKIGKPVGETAEALKSFAGEAGQGAITADTLNKSFQDLVESKEGVGAFQSAIEGIADPGLWGNIDNVSVGIIKTVTLGMADVSSTTEKARERFKGLGEQLASLEPGRAADAFQSMALKTDGSSESLKRLLEYMPAYRKSLEEQAKAAGVATDDQSLLDLALGDTKIATDEVTGAVGVYKDAADGAKPISEEVAKALEDIGVNAEGAAVDLVKFADAMLAAGLNQLSARDAARNLESAIDAVTTSITTNGTTLDITTEKGRNNQAALDGIAGAGLQVVKANAANGESQKVLQGNLRTTYDSLVAGAKQFGLTDDEAIALARDILKVPPKVNIDSWMSNAAKKMADDTKAAADAVDGRVINITVATHRTETTLQKVIREISTKPAAGEGTVLLPVKGGKAAGGAVSGPGTSTSDEAGLYRLADGEHVFDSGDVKKMGGQQAVYKFRQQLQASAFPGMAGGGAVGTRAAATQLMAHSFTAPNVSLEGLTVMVTNPFTGEQVRGMVTSVARHEATGAVTAADSQSKYMRKGR